MDVDETGFGLVLALVYLDVLDLEYNLTYLSLDSIGSPALRTLQIELDSIENVFLQKKNFSKLYSKSNCDHLMQSLLVWSLLKWSLHI